MNASDIKGITSGNLEHDPFYFSIPEKLDKFGYCIDFSGYGEGKTDKAQLCILDAINKKEQPNILIICPKVGKESWYTCLLKGVGLDFKFLNSARDAVMYFSPETSNLILMDDEILADSGGTIYETIKSSELLWDLMIIDGSSSVDGMDMQLYIENVRMKAEKLLIFAPYPAEYTESPDKIKGVVKALLRDSAMASRIDFFNIDARVMEFNMDSPLVNYPKEDSGENKVSIVRYAFPPEDIPTNLHIDEQQGVRYSSGGNVFEEYDLPERKIYQKNQYSRADAEILKNKDKKLEKFLGIMETIMASKDKTALVYFESELTADYIEKILSTIYFDKADSIVYFRRTSFDIRQIKKWYETVRGRSPRVILMNDLQSEVCGVYSPVTHIINYELPDSPVILQQRYKRRGLTRGEQPEFIIFLDENKMFDSRVLARAMAGNLYKAFRMNVPSENVMFDIEGIDGMLADTIADIKYVADFTGSVGASFDVISRFKNDYNVSPAIDLSTASSTHAYSQKKLETIAKALGITELIKTKDVDKGALLRAVSAKVKELRSGYTYFDNDMCLKTVPHGTPKNEAFRDFDRYLDGNPFNLGLVKAKTVLKEAIDGKNDFAYIKDAVEPLPDAMKPAVLYNIWIYWHKIMGVGGSYAQFIKAYNEGVI